MELLAQSSYEALSASFSHNVTKTMESQIVEIHSPNVLDLSRDTEYASQAALWGIEVRVGICFLFCEKYGARYMILDEIVVFRDCQSWEKFILLVARRIGLAWLTRTQVNVFLLRCFLTVEEHCWKVL